MDGNRDIISAHQANNNTTPVERERQGTPERPPYSPVTPVLVHLAPIPGGASIVPPGLETSGAGATTNATSGIGAHNIATVAAANPNISTEPLRQPNVPKYDDSVNRNRRAVPPPQSIPVIRPEPSPVPISESDNPDAIALRSAITVLQLQKQKALNDIKTLDELKRAAAADPEGFSRELIAGRLTQEDRQSHSFIDTDLQPGGEDDDDDDEMSAPDSSKFGKLPKPQNVVRMPPINWSKYQVVGESLDKMHEEQRNRPYAGAPRQDSSQRAPEHVIAAPYRPLTDKIESPGKGKAKRDRKT